MQLRWQDQMACGNLVKLHYRDLHEQRENKGHNQVFACRPTAEQILKAMINAYRLKDVKRVRVEFGKNQKKTETARKRSNRLS